MNTLSEPVSLARRLIQFDTRNPGNDEASCISFLAGLLKKEGFSLAEFSFDKNRPSLIARSGPGKKPALCFAGHIDTVPLGEAEWSHDPFGGEIIKGRLFGRGSSDMKSGIAAMVSAACRLKKTKAKDYELMLIIAAGEESGCQGSYYLAKKADLMGKAGALIIAEPTNNYPLIGHKGALWLDISFTGKTAHGAMPEKGVNAVYKATEAVQQLQKLTFDEVPNRYLGKPTLNIGYLHGGVNVNSVPDFASVGVDIRTLPETDHKMLLQKISGFLGNEARVKPIVNVSPLWSDPQEPWINIVYKTVAPILGVEPTPRTVAFFTDGPPLKAAFGGVPTIVLGPGSPSLAHQTDEYCLVDEIETATLIYEQIAKHNLPI